jgi:chromosome segregation ATPase
MHAEVFMRSAILVALTLLLAATTPAQQAKSPEQSLEGILTELRQLRQDLRTMVGTAQRAQILTVRVQLQESVVRRLEERVDNNRGRLGDLQAEERQQAFEIKRSEGLLAQTDNPQAKKDLEETIAALKAGLERRTNIEQETQTRLTEAEEQLRIEQAKLSTLQSELDQLDKKLQ